MIQLGWESELNPMTICYSQGAVCCGNNLSLSDTRHWLLMCSRHYNNSTVHCWHQQSQKQTFHWPWRSFHYRDLFKCDISYCTHTVVNPEIEVLSFYYTTASHLWPVFEVQVVLAYIHFTVHGQLAEMPTHRHKVNMPTRQLAHSDYKWSFVVSHTNMLLNGQHTKYLEITHLCLTVLFNFYVSILNCTCYYSHSCS